ncbi:hypothetical protein D3C85_1025840 [compost metagenome]
MGGLFKGGRRLHQAQRGMTEGDRQQPQQDRKQQRQQQALQQDLAQPGSIVTSGRLCGETCRTHTQKTHGPGQQAVQAGTHCHRTQLVGMGQMADHRAVDQRHQGHGNIRKDHRRGQRPDPPMGGAVAPVVKQLGHAGSLRVGIVATVNHARRQSAGRC